MHHNTKWLAAAAISLSFLSTPALARDNLSIIGSRTVAPYAQLVADEIMKQGFSKAEIVESNTSQAFKHFCRGVGALYPDVAMASRPIKDAEASDCKSHGVKAFTEVKIGYDGLLIGYRSDSGFGELSLTGKQIWLAMAKNVPVNGAMVPNPYKTWSDIDPSLPAAPILLYLPEKGVAMRDLLGELILNPVCTAEPALAAMADDAREEACLAAREDGTILDFSNSRDGLTAMTESKDQPVVLTNWQLISTTPQANAQLAKLDGVAPSAATIASGEYKASRSHYLYVKNQHIGQVPGIMEFVSAFLSDAAQGPNGYLTAKGWLPLKDGERKELGARAASLSN
jgi:phosphate transport system substrate-binding protein